MGSKGSANVSVKIRTFGGISELGIPFRICSLTVVLGGLMVVVVVVVFVVVASRFACSGLSRLSFGTAVRFAFESMPTVTVVVIVTGGTG